MSNSLSPTILVYTIIAYQINLLYLTSYPLCLCPFILNLYIFFPFIPNLITFVPLFLTFISFVPWFLTLTSFVPWFLTFTSVVSWFLTLISFVLCFLTFITFVPWFLTLTSFVPWFLTLISVVPVSFFSPDCYVSSKPTDCASLWQLSGMIQPIKIMLPLVRTGVWTPSPGDLSP